MLLTYDIHIRNIFRSQMKNAVSYMWDVTVWY